MGDMRKTGELPIDITEPDELRRLRGVELLGYDDPQDEADWITKDVSRQIDNWLPRSVWADQNIFLTVAVEKMDLVKLFAPCGHWILNPARLFLT